MDLNLTLGELPLVTDCCEGIAELIKGLSDARNLLWDREEACIIKGDTAASERHAKAASFVNTAIVMLNAKTKEAK